MQDKVDQTKETEQVNTGCRFVISDALFIDILCEKFGFQRDHLRLVDVTTNHYYKGVLISVCGTDPKMPELKEVEEIPFVTPLIKVQDGKVVCEGFEEIYPVPTSAKL